MAKSLERGVGVAELAKNGPAVDIEAMIDAFLADDSRVSLELPRSLTAEQRKQAKRLAEQRQTLKCESYGYGEERQLHLFKKESPQRLRVKNTFIDGWEAPEGEEQAIFRSVPSSMPMDLLQRTPERCKASSEEAPVLSGKLAKVASPCKAAQPLGSTPGPELPPLPDGFQVRNTFIHIESEPAVERIVQSLPHGMFRHRLEAELSAQGPARSAAPAPAAAVTAPEAAAQAALHPGAEVVIQGLAKLPEFNGLIGVVQSLDEASGRYDVLLHGPAGQCGSMWVKVRGENCRPRVPPPPRAAPTLSLDCFEDAQGPTAVPPTPHWEEDLACQAGVVEQRPCVMPLRLSALI